MWAPGSSTREGFDLMRPGLEREYRRGRGALRAVRKDPSAEAVHQWRKRVKDLWYHLRLLQGVWPATMGAAADEAHALSDLLGDHHDLSVLIDERASRRRTIPGWRGSPAWPSAGRRRFWRRRFRSGIASTPRSPGGSASAWRFTGWCRAPPREAEVHSGLSVSLLSR